MLKPFLLLALVALTPVFLRPAAAQTPAPAAPHAATPAPLTAAQARQALDVLQDEKKRTELIAVLRALAATAPVVAPAHEPAPAETPASAPPAAPEPAPAAPAITLKPHSLGAQLLVALSGWSSQVARDAASAARTTTNLPALWQWLTELATDRSASTLFLTALAWLALIVGCALGLEFLSAWTLRRPRAALARHLPQTNGENTRQLRMLPYALVRLLFDLVPVAVFAVTGNMLTSVIDAMSEQTRLIVLAIVNAYAICRAAIAVGTMLVSPSDRRLRLWRLDDSGAQFVMAWLRRLVVIAVLGDALIEVALLLGLDQSAHDGLDRLIALVLALLLIVVVVRSRHRVAVYIRTPRHGTEEVTRWRAWLAEAWPYLAVITIVTAWIGMATGERTGIAALYLPGVTLAAFIGARLATIVVLGVLERALRLDPQTRDTLPGLNQRIAHYRRPLEYLAVAVIAALSFVVLLQLWGAPAFDWFVAGGIGHRLVSALVTVTVAVIAAIAIWEVSQALLERHLSRLGDDGSSARSVRLLTLMPMLRAALLTLILTVVGLTALSEIGVNIAPLLAGASIAGIAIGFGSQKLVQDVITGMFALFENAIQIGDTVTVAGLTGAVEGLSVRSVRLRAADGAVHIIPFSAVTTITNNNRGLGNAAVTVTVAYDTDIDRVCDILRDIAGQMREDPDFGPRILEDLRLFGIDQLGSWGVTITGRIPCTDTGRLPVQREFNRRLKQRFDAEKIVLSAPP